MKSFASTELKQHLGDILAAAEHEPIAITRHRKTHYVLVDIETYERRFATDPRRAYAIEDMPQEHLALLEEALADLK